MIWGVDVSDYQPVVDMPRLRGEGFDFCIAKASEGTGWKGDTFTPNLNNGRNAGILMAAYHYVRGSSVAELRNIESKVPKDCPLILDVERGSGNIGTVRTLTDRCRNAGYTLPLLYLPPWYWREIGSPGLGGLAAGLWKSHYANYEGGFASQIFNRDHDWHMSHFDAYGGLNTEILQFTSSATAAGVTPIDANAYRGTREQLAALLGGSQEDDVPPWASEMLKHIMWCYTGSYQPYQAPGHPNRIDGTPVTWLDYTRWNDIHSVEESGRAAGRTQALRELLTAVQADPGSYDREAVKARIKDAVNAKIADEVVGRINVEVGEEPPPDPVEPPSA